MSIGTAKGQYYFDLIVFISAGQDRFNHVISVQYLIANHRKSVIADPT